MDLLFGSCLFYFLLAVCSACCPLHAVCAEGRAYPLDGLQRWAAWRGLCCFSPSELNVRGAELVLARSKSLSPAETWRAEGQQHWGGAKWAHGSCLCSGRCRPQLAWEMAHKPLWYVIQGRQVVARWLSDSDCCLWRTDVSTIGVVGVVLERRITCFLFNNYKVYLISQNLMV